MQNDIHEMAEARGVEVKLVTMKVPRQNAYKGGYQVNGGAAVWGDQTFGTREAAEGDAEQRLVAHLATLPVVGCQWVDPFDMDYGDEAIFWAMQTEPVAAPAPTFFVGQQVDWKQERVEIRNLTERGFARIFVPSRRRETTVHTKFLRRP